MNSTFEQCCEELWNRPKISFKQLRSTPFAEVFESIRVTLNIDKARQCLWHAMNRVDGIPTCHMCANSLKFMHNYYPKFCSRECMTADPQHESTALEKRKAALLSRYGVENAMHSSALKEKLQETNIEKYGVDNVFKSNKIKTKIDATNLEKYGTIFPFQSEAIKEKIKSTNLERYGVDHAAKLPETHIQREKRTMEKHGVSHTSQLESTQTARKETTLEKYGVDNVFKSGDTQEKIRDHNLRVHGVEYITQSQLFKDQSKKTLMARYGVDNISKHPDTIEKVKKTNLARYNVEYYAQRHISKQSLDILENKNLFEPEYNNAGANQLASRLGVTPTTIYLAAKKHNLTEIPGPNGYERVISSILDSISIDYERNNKTVLNGKHLDFYIPSHNLAIEVGSVYWHSEKYKRTVNYHKDKWEICHNLGVTLLQYFDVELFNYSHLIASKIHRMLNIPVPVIGARKCIIAPVTWADETNFLNFWHMQGHIKRRSWCMGAYHNNELVAIMSIYHDNAGAKLERWATDTTRSWPGLFSKVLNQFKLQTGFSGELITFSNNCYGNGKVYESSGFELDYVTRLAMCSKLPIA